MLKKTFPSCGQDTLFIPTIDHPNGDVGKLFVSFFRFVIHAIRPAISETVTFWQPGGQIVNCDYLMKVADIALEHSDHPK